MYYTKADIDSTAGSTPISSITNSTASAKKVTLNLSDIQIYEENGSSRYLTPVKVPTPILITTKIYDLPTPQKPKRIAYKINTSIPKKCLNNIDFDKIEVDLSNNDIENEILEQCETIKQSMKDLISQDYITNNNEVKEEEIISNNNTKNTTHLCEYISHDEIEKPINEKFIVNLFESRPSKRWNKCRRNLHNEELNKKIRNIDDTLHITDLDKSKQINLQNNLNENGYVPLDRFNSGLLNVVSNSVICDMIKDIQQSIKPPSIAEILPLAPNLVNDRAEKSKKVSF